MGRKILSITTDQQRYDALGCNGGRVARTPVADSLAAAGIKKVHSASGSCAVSFRLSTKIADTIAAAIRYIGGTISLSVLSIR